MNTLEEILTHACTRNPVLLVLFICSFSTRGKEEGTGRGAGGASVMQEVREGRGGETEALTEDQEKGGAVWKNCPTSMHA